MEGAHTFLQLLCLRCWLKKNLEKSGVPQIQFLSWQVWELERKIYTDVCGYKPKIQVNVSAIC